MSVGLRPTLRRLPTKARKSLSKGTLFSLSSSDTMWFRTESGSQRTPQGAGSVFRGGVVQRICDHRAGRSSDQAAAEVVTSRIRRRFGRGSPEGKAMAASKVLLKGYLQHLTEVAQHRDATEESFHGALSRTSAPIAAS